MNGWLEIHPAHKALAYALFGLGSGKTAFTFSAILFGLTAWSIPAIMAAACGDILGSARASAGLGFITLFFGVGQVVGPALAGILADYRGSFSSSLLLASLVALSGAIGSWLIRPSSPALSESPQKNSGNSPGSAVLFDTETSG